MKRERLYQIIIDYNVPYNVRIELVDLILDEIEKSKTLSSAPNAAPVRDDGARELIVQAMQSAWDEWVHDTGCFPCDFRIERGPKLFFEAGQWATLAADGILASLPAPAGDVPGEAQPKLST